MSLATEKKMNNNTEDDWEDVSIPNNEEQEQVEFELEEEPEVQESKPTVQESEPIEEQKSEDVPKELDGIETKGAEKRIRQLIRQRKERDEQIESLLAQNEELQNNLKQKNNEVYSITNRSIAANEEALEKTIRLAKDAYAEAFENNETQKVLEAQEILNNAQSDLKTLRQLKAGTERQQRVNEEQNNQVQQQQPRQSQVIDVKAQEWAERNDWFGQDTIKTAAALALDAELKSEGYDPNEDDFYMEIDKRLASAFTQPSVRAEDNTLQPSQVVSGASRSSPNSGSKVKLSKEDVRLANKWGIPLEQYAAEKLKVTRADGEYTDIT